MSVTLSKNIAIAILAAGSSSRFGSPKQLIAWNKTTLIKHRVKTVLASDGAQDFIVLGAHFDMIYKEIKDAKITVLKHARWEGGIGSSIAYVAKHLMKTSHKVNGLLIVLADQPLITSAYLNNLIAQFTIGNNQILVSSYKDGTKGVPVLFDACYLQELSGMTGDFGAKKILKKYHNAVIEVDSNVQNFDIDSETDYLKLQKIIARSKQ
ncbi:nucleotidyltransferase family protein [Tamlana fucoidanivorans]|uniref:Nucleotidyltransferase family protein n=1 Tax=Allotamlana fucoidanivorans TaxID=2583814 RepID=A0A5C4SGS8_9FLAO|nr:nucleotidyltransferase family protein [Tamlana fucoidanivorans]TNJ42908.1 nucleotidyltransferase family protein [Tamlana fucoidanivorans]